jgi:hypothetical protein
MSLLNGNGVHAYGWLKPTLTVELVAGGSLLPNTKYYVCGVMGYTVRTYSLVGSALSDIHEITTTTTDLSIKVTHKTYRNITAFADNGDSRTLITSARHCVADTVVGAAADTIKIATGSYAGTWTVDEWVSYDQFIINTPYIDNVAVQFYTDSQYYNRPYYGGNTYQGMSVYISNVNPIDSDGLFINHLDYWDRRVYQAPDGGFANPKTYTSRPDKSTPEYSGHPELNRYGVGVYQVLNDYGAINVDLNGSTDLEEIYDEVQLSGFIYNCGYSLCGFARKPKFSLFGSLRAMAGTLLTATGVEIVHTGDFYSSDWDYDLMTFTDCAFTSMGTFSVAKCFTANNSVYFDTATSNNYSGYIRGTDLIVFGAPRFSSGFGDEITTYYDEFRAATLPISVIKDKIFRTNGSALLQQVSYNGSRFERCTLTPFYWVLNNALGNKPDVYMLQNCTIRHAYSYDWCIRFYHYAQYTYNEIKFLNVNCPDDADNHKRIIRNRDYFNLICRWYRRAEFYITDKDGTELIGVTVTITDNASNQYTDITDSNGYVFIDVLEQFDIITDDLLYSDPHTTTYYTDFVIRVLKDGYNDYQVEFSDMYTNEKQAIALQPYPSTELLQPEVELEHTEPTTIAIIEIETE